MFDFFDTGLINYWIIIILMMTGLYTVISKSNLIKKIIGLGIFQVSVIMFFISMGKVKGGTAPIAAEGFEVYSNPVPHVLMLTAIVVAVATAAFALSLVVRINEAYGTIEEDEIRELEIGESDASASVEPEPGITEAEESGP